MNEVQTPASERDPVLARMFEASHRLVAGLVPRKRMAALQQEVLATPSSYPWERVVDGILADPVEPQQLVQQGLRAQRDWILRGGRERPGPSLKMHGKKLLAIVAARAIFFVIFGFALIVTLILVKANWPALDIYVVLDKLREWMPGLFRQH